MQTKVSKKLRVRKKKSLAATRAIKKYKGENEEILQALDIMKRAQMVKTIHPVTLDRYSYHSI